MTAQAHPPFDIAASHEIASASVNFHVPVNVLETYSAIVTADVNVSGKRGHIEISGRAGGFNTRSLRNRNVEVGRDRRPGSTLGLIATDRYRVAFDHNFYWRFLVCTVGFPLFQSSNPLMPVYGHLCSIVAGDFRVAPETFNYDMRRFVNGLLHGIVRVIVFVAEDFHLRLIPNAPVPVVPTAYFVGCLS